MKDLRNTAKKELNKEVQKAIKKYPVIGILIFILTSLFLYFNPTSPDEATLLRVVDGDTLIVEHEGEEKRLRLIGIDTPESVHPDSSKNKPEGEIASDYVDHLLHSGQKLYLEKDKSDTDRYKRLLRYVYLSEEKHLDQMLNAILLREGLAKVTIYPPDDKYEKEFIKLEEKAREEERGFHKPGSLYYEERRRLN